MKRTVVILAVLVSAILVSNQAIERMSAQGYSGALPVVSPHSGTSLRAVYTAGTVSNGGSRQAITADATGLLTTASQGDCAAPTFTACNIIYWNSGVSLATTTSVLTAFKPGNVVIAYVTTDGTDILLVTPASWSPGQASSTYTDGEYFVPPSACVFDYGTTVVDTGFPAMTVTATGEIAYRTQTNVTSGTVTVTCNVTPPKSRTTTGTGITVTGIDLLYSIGTTSLASSADPIVYSTTGPATAGAAGAGTVSTTPLGALTFTPTSGNFQGTAITSGLMYRTNMTAGTPLAWNTPTKLLAVKQIFTTNGGGATKTIIDLFGATVYFKGFTY